MAWTTNDIPDLTGRTAVITGANSGLGLESAKALAAAGATVVMTACNPERLAAAAADVATQIPGSSIDTVELDLASLASIETAATEIAGSHPRVDILINNAGVMALPERETADGRRDETAIGHSVASKEGL